MFENISVKNALKMAYGGKAVLYDIREEASYKKGHLPTAKHIEEEDVEEELRRRKKGRNKEVVLAVFYCDYGNRSMRLARELSEKGYSRIGSMVGGYHAYEGYVEIEKNALWTMEWKERTGKEKSVDSQGLDK